MEGDNYTTSIYAEEGKTAHKLAEMALQSNRPAAAFVGRILEVTGKEEVTQEMADNVQVYLDKLGEYASCNGDIELQTIDSELCVNVSHVMGVEGQFGTLDASIYIPTFQELQIHDLKYGRGVRVDADSNEQLMLYALGRYHVVSLVAQVKTILLVIHQPRLNHLSEWRCTIQDLIAFGESVRPKAKIAYELFHSEIGNLTAGQHLTPGDKQCRFCNARPTCPALAKLAHKEVIEHFGDLDAPGALTLPASNEELGKNARMVPLLKAWCAAVDAKVEAEVLSGRAVPGFKLVQGKAGNRYWTDTAAVGGILSGYTFKENVYTDPELKSPAKVEKITGKKHEAADEIKQYIGQAEGRPAVVPDTDPRSVLVMAPVETFFTDLEA